MTDSLYARLEAIGNVVQADRRIAALEAEVQRLRTALEALNVTIKTTDNGRSWQLCWKGDYDGISDSELRAEVLRWLRDLESSSVTEGGTANG